MTRARDVADTQDNTGGAVAPVVSGKNFAINGGFDIAQRGTSFTIGGTAAYTLDRWYASGSGGATTAVISQQTTGAAVGTTAHLRTSYSTNTTFCNMFSAFEYQNVQVLQGRTVTLSFKARRSSGYVNGLVAEVQTGTVANTLTGGTWTGVGSCTITNANLPTGTTSADWGSASVTFTIPAGTQGIRIRIGEETFQSSGAYYEASSVQLEIGSIATPFSRAGGGSIGAELALCQRYYYRVKASSGYAFLGGGNNAANATTCYMPFSLAVPMRILPTSVEYGGNIGIADGTTNNSSLTSITAGGGGGNVFSINVTTTSSVLTTNRFYTMQDAGAGTAYLGFSAEL